jgi:hypothetical protein
MIFCFNYGCLSTEKAVSYTISNYIIESDASKRIEFDKHFISYKGMLLEFNTTVVEDATYKIESKETIVKRRVDTLSVYLLDSKLRCFYEFDGFNKHAKQISNGKFSKKKWGMTISDTIINGTSFLIERTLADTVLNQQKLYYYKDIHKGVSGKDSAISNIYFVKKSNFVSIYDLILANHFKPDYSMVGYSVFLIESNTIGVASFENVKMLNNLQVDVCNHYLKVIAKSKNL